MLQQANKTETVPLSATLIHIAGPAGLQLSSVSQTSSLTAPIHFTLKANYGYALQTLFMFSARQSETLTRIILRFNLLLMACVF